MAPAVPAAWTAVAVTLALPVASALTAIVPTMPAPNDAWTDFSACAVAPVP